MQLKAAEAKFMHFVKIKGDFTGTQINSCEKIEIRTNENEIYLLVGELVHNEHYGINVIDQSCKNIFLPFFVKESESAKKTLKAIIDDFFIAYDASRNPYEED